MQTTIFFRFEILTVALFLAAGCARLETLTPALLAEAEEKWRMSRPEVYTIVVEMEGDRVEPSRYEVLVQAGHVVSLRRNDQVVLPGRGQDYSMEGLFRILRQELGLAEQPALLGASSGYSAYLMARFDTETGRLMHYRRTVGGTTNTIDIKVMDFEPQQ